MFQRLQSALQHIQRDLTQVLDSSHIRGACQEVGYRFRQRLLDPVTTIQLFVLQVLRGNVAIACLREFTDRVFSEGAYCKAWRRLPLPVLQTLLRRVGAALQPTLDESGRWRGHRTFHLDGSSFSMPATPELQRHFGQPGQQLPGCGFPVAHLLTLFHAGTGFLLQVLAAPLRTHDLAQAGALHPEVAAGDVLIGDRAFGSFAHFALLRQRELHGVFRAHQRQVIDFRVGRPHNAPGRQWLKGLPTARWLKQLGFQDQLVEYCKPKVRPVWLAAADYAVLPPTRLLRELRYSSHQRGCRTKEVTLVTTLLDETRYPAEDLAEL